MHPIVILLLFLILAVMTVGGLAAYLKLKPQFLLRPERFSTESGARATPLKKHLPIQAPVRNPSGLKGVKPRSS